MFDETNDPVEGATVFALRRAWFQGKARLVPAGSATSDDAGQYRLRSLPPGSYFVRAMMRDSGGSIAAHVVAAQGGAKIIRTHDVSETVQALRVAAAIRDKR